MSRVNAFAFLAVCTLLVCCSVKNEVVIADSPLPTVQSQAEPGQIEPTLPPNTPLAENEARPASVHASVPDWSVSGTIDLDQVTPGASFVAVIALASGYEFIVGRAEGSSEGSARIEYLIPTGSAPGGHVLAVRSVADGKRIGARTTNVVVPEACRSGSDRDGDGLSDWCDSNLFDGPNADFDGDGRKNNEDNCPQVSNADQARNLERSSGAACDGREGFNFVAMLQAPCRGLVPTIVGTDGDDTLTGTDGDDIISAGSGDDIISAGSGDDIICVASGRNVIDAGPGNDRVYGGAGADLIRGGPGDDHVFAGSGDDEVSDGTGDDRIDGGAGDDACESAALAIRCEA